RCRPCRFPGGPLLAHGGGAHSLVRDRPMSPADRRHRCITIRVRAGERDSRALAGPCRTCRHSLGEDRSRCGGGVARGVRHRSQARDRVEGADLIQRSRRAVRHIGIAPAGSAVRGLRGILHDEAMVQRRMAARRTCAVHRHHARRAHSLADTEILESPRLPIRMKIVIVGCGVIGVTTAYCLKRRGHEVTVIDRESGPGRETSFANGGLLTPSMPDPWNAPGSWRVLLGSLGRSDAALQLRLRTLPALVGWGIQFLRHSRPAVFERSRVHNLRLALYSLNAMDALRQQTDIEYGRSALGTLRVFRDQAALDRTAMAAGGLGCEGLGFRKLTVPQMVDLEPALAPIAHQLTGAIHYEMDEAGDAHQFCRALADQAQRLGVEFRFHTEVRALQAHAGRV